MTVLVQIWACLASASRPEGRTGQRRLSQGHRKKRGMTLNSVRFVAYCAKDYPREKIYAAAEVRELQTGKQGRKTAF